MGVAIMQSIITPVVVNYFRVWTKMPSLMTTTHTKPVAPIQQEDYVVEYTEDQLRNMIINNHDLFGKTTIDPAAIRGLPDGYLTDLYNSTRYLKPSVSVPPVRLRDAWSSSAYHLPSYIMLSALLAAIYNIETVTTDPFKQWRANNIARLLKQIHFMMIQIVKSNPSGIKPAQIVVSSYTEEVGEGEELLHTAFVYIDAVEAAPLLSNGWTAKSIAEHWVANKTQPQ